MFSNYIEKFNEVRELLMKSDDCYNLEGFESGVNNEIHTIKLNLLNKTWIEMLNRLEEDRKYCYDCLLRKSLDEFHDFSWNFCCGTMLVCDFFLKTYDTRNKK